MEDEEIKYKVVDNKLIIEEVPGNILTSKMVRSAGCFLYSSIDLCEGIEEIEEDAFVSCLNLKHVHFPNTLRKIGPRAFKSCPELRTVEIPDNVSYIGESCFSFCSKLKKVILPSSLVVLETDMFFHCSKLEEVQLPDRLFKIGDFCFKGCQSLKEIELPKDLKTIGYEAFFGCNSFKEVVVNEGIRELNNTFESCENLEKVKLPSSLKILGSGTFSDCINLKFVEIKEGVEIIGTFAFAQCNNLKEVKLPSSVIDIGNYAFIRSGITNIAIPENVSNIGGFAFFGCVNLKKISFNDALKTIGEEAFENCFNLSDVKLSDDIECLGSKVFANCSNLRNVILPKNLKEIKRDSFFKCENLNNLAVPEGVKKIERGAFNGCVNLQKISLPSTIENVGNDYYKLNALVINEKGENRIVDVGNGNFQFCHNDCDKLFLCSFYDGNCFFYNDGEYISFNENDLKNNKAIKKMIDNGELDRQNYIRAYYWSKKKIIPGSTVIKNMPIKDIDNFCLNNNHRAWSSLLKMAGIESEECKSSFFKLCYVLGLFSNSSNNRDKSFNFIKENIINVLSQEEIHSRFDGFDLNNGYNEEYMEFFIKYYNGEDFLKIVNEYNEEIDLICASYNNFSNVKKVYPNKTIHTNRRSDLLLPSHVIDAVKIKEYSNVHIGNEQFAYMLGRYGYSQDQFDRLQEWYNVGKNINLNNMSLFIQDDNAEEGITYELIKKDNCLCAVLGNITNCCQVMGGAGESCVRYGMTMNNSGFIVFKHNNKIIGQAWVWYDELSKTVCLDNIEVPKKYCVKINNNNTIKKNFVECLLRVESGFKLEMNDRGFLVDRVVIGKGFNDIQDILDEEFDITKNPSKLSDYRGYSDAKDQYVILNKRELNKIRV